MAEKGETEEMTENQKLENKQNFIGYSLLSIFIFLTCLYFFPEYLINLSKQFDNIWTIVAYFTLLILIITPLLFLIVLYKIYKMDYDHDDREG